MRKRLTVKPSIAALGNAQDVENNFRRTFLEFGNAYYLFVGGAVMQSSDRVRSAMTADPYYTPLREALEGTTLDGNRQKTREVLERFLPFLEQIRELFQLIPPSPPGTPQDSMDISRKAAESWAKDVAQLKELLARNVQRAPGASRK